jgi:hypothetical protein
MKSRPGCWVVLTTEGSRMGPGRVPAPSISAMLTADGEFGHCLRGAHGKRVLEAVAASWNRTGFVLTLKEPVKTRAEVTRAQAMKWSNP